MLETDARKTDFHMKEVSKDIIKSATIVTKPFTVLDKVAQEGQPDVAHEVGMFIGALALLRTANRRNNLTIWFIMDIWCIKSRRFVWKTLYEQQTYGHRIDQWQPFSCRVLEGKSSQGWGHSSPQQ